MSLARLSVKNPVVANLLMVAIILVGGVSFYDLPRELMSLVTFNWAFIIVPYPGVSAEEIERLVSIPIEDEVQDVKGIDTISTVSSEGRAAISVRFKEMSDEEFRVRFQDIKTEFEKADLPDDVLDPEFIAFSTAEFVPVISVHIHGQIPEKRLSELARDLRDEILDVKGIANAELSGVRDREVWIEVDPVRLEGYGLSLAQIQSAIAAHGINIPAGRITFSRQEVLVRTLGEFQNVKEIEKVIVRSTPDGQTVQVGDIASVKLTFEEEETRDRLNQDPVASLSVTKQTDGDSIFVTDEVKRLSREFEKRYKHLVKVTFSQDSSEPIVDHIGKLSLNALLGFLAVFTLLLVVLGLRNAVLAALGIPLSFLVCFIFMNQTGDSLNTNSLFALVLVLGIIVDDAIIIVENCYRHLQLGKSWHKAAIEGTQEVMTPILSATCTTIAVFLPLMLMPGVMGKFMRVIPIVVSLALLASLFEAFIILPSHFADWPGKRSQKTEEKSWLKGIKDLYERTLRIVVKRRYIFVIGLMLVLGTGASLIFGHVGTDMYAGEEIPTFQIRITMPTGTNFEATAKTIKEFEKVVAKLPKSEVRSYQSTTGRIIAQEGWLYGTHVAEMWLDLTQSYNRHRTAEEIMADLRIQMAKISGPVNIELAKMPSGPPLGKPVELKIKGKYFNQLKAAAKEVKNELNEMPGLTDVADDFLSGKREIRFKIDPDRAAMYGLSVGQVGMALRTAINGVTATKMYDGDERIDIVVRIAKDLLKRPEDLLKLPIVTPMGTPVTLGNVATYTIQPTYSEIKRYKQQRTITVTANVDKNVTTSVAANQALQEKLKDIDKRYPGISLDFSGEFKEFRETFSSLIKLFGFGIILIYAILGTQFRSYSQPLVILFTVPFAGAGALLGLLISGNPFSVLTLYGIVALAGVAVNDAIVLISFVNNLKAEGMGAIEAVVTAGRMRLRPIMLTSITTIFGLIPMAIGLGGMSLTWSPMANTIVWGLAVATMLTIFLIPALYIIIVEDIRGGLGRLFGNSKKA